MYEHTMAKQMLRNMVMRGEAVGADSPDIFGDSTMAEQMTQNEKMRGGGLPKTTDETANGQQKDQENSKD